MCVKNIYRPLINTVHTYRTLRYNVSIYLFIFILIRHKLRFKFVQTDLKFK